MALKLLRVVPAPGLSNKYAAVFVLPNGRQPSFGVYTGKERQKRTKISAEPSN